MKTIISNVVLLSLSNICLGQSINIGPLYNCFLENYNPTKNTTEDCFSCFINAEITENLDTLRTCRKDFLPTAHIDCKDNESNKQEFLDCLEDSLEFQTALRCLDDSENAVEAVTDGLICIIEAQKNATMVIKNLLGLEIEKFADPEIKWLSKYRKYSDPYFAECFHPNEISDSSNINQSECLMNLEIKKLVANCIGNPAGVEADVDTIINVLDCAKESANFWIKNNIPEISDPEELLLGGLII